LKARHTMLSALATSAAMVAVVGIALLSPSSSPSATAQPGSSPKAASVGVVSHSHGARQTVTEKGVRFSFGVPGPVGFGSWERFSSLSTDKSPGGPISLNRSVVGPQGAEAMIYWTSFPNGDYADPCTRLLGHSIGSSAADLAAAVSTAPGTEIVEKPSGVTLGGRPARHLVLTVRKSTGCDPGFFYSWKDVYGGALWPTTAVGDTIRVWIVDVGGTRLFIAAATSEDATARLKRAVKHIVESIRFA
jgi:hypothetical protein